MQRYLLFIMAVCCTLGACGSESAQKNAASQGIALPKAAEAPTRESWSSVSGTVEGAASHFLVAYAAPVARSNGAYGIALAFSSDPSFCESTLKTRGTHDYMIVAIIARALEPQTFKLVPGEPSGSGLAAASLARVRGDAPLQRHDGVSGWITLNAIHDGAYTGKLSARFADGGQLMGDFHALTCPKLDPLELS